MQILHIKAYIHMNSQSIALSWNYTDKQNNVVTWVATKVLYGYAYCVQKMNNVESNY